MHSIILPTFDEKSVKLLIGPKEKTLSQGRTRVPTSPFCSRTKQLTHWANGRPEPDGKRLLGSP